MKWIRELGRLLLIITLQVLLFDHLHISMWGFPMVYILFLLNLSPRIPRWAEMFIGFGVGLIMDIWHSSLGIHMAACVDLACRRIIKKVNMVQDIERVKDNVCSLTIGTIEYLKCVALLTSIHHFIVFSLEAWSLRNWWIIIAQTLISSTLTLLIILGYDRIKR